MQEEKSAVQSDKVSMDQLVGQMRRELADYKGKMMGDMERRAQSLQDQVDRVRRQLQQAGMERGRQKVRRRGKLGDTAGQISRLILQ